MSQRLISLNQDLKRLRDTGYNVEEREGYLVLWDIPYVNSRCEIEYGVLVSGLELSGDCTMKPSNHVVFFSGNHPCNRDGSEIVQIKHGSAEQKIDNKLTTQHSFSSKPADGYRDYYEKMTTYISIISNPAKAIDSKVTAQTYPVFELEEGDDSPFQYIDTASSRADIVSATQKLKLSKIAIVGTGGTGSYVLDLVVKTPVREIHLFDGDVFLQHNAFRTPGAPSLVELKEMPLKVEYLKKRYSKMHCGIVVHPYHLDTKNVNELGGMDFVFICMDGGENKRHVIEELEKSNIPFVDTGIGIQLADNVLQGLVRLTTSTEYKRDHLRGRVSLSDEGDNDYLRNIQIADLNALNAALAVIKWKKIFGFYNDLESEHHCVYDLDGNIIHNEDKS